MALKLGTWHQILEQYKDCSNSDLGLTLPFLRQAQILHNARTYDFMESFENVYSKMFR